MPELTKLPAEQAAHHDAGKPMFDLLPAESLAEIQLVMEFGAKKYGAQNWRKGTCWRKYLGSAMRHLFAWAAGEDLDPDSGLSHLAHAGCNILFLLSYSKTGAGTDDRYKT